MPGIMIRGWIDKDVSIFDTNVTYIFADQLIPLILTTGGALLGAVLALCLGGGELMRKTLSFTGIKVLNTFLFSAMRLGGGSFRWPCHLSS